MSTSSPMFVPAPQQIQPFPQVVRLGDHWQIMTTGSPSDAVAAEMLRDEAAACFGFTWDLAQGVPQTRPRGLVRLMAYEGSVPQNAPELFVEQGYVLTISPGLITIAAPSDTGRFYGVQTLRQAMRSAHRNRPADSLMAMQIVDWPALRWRGISDDISRGQVSTIEDFRRIVRDLAYYKKNLYQPYIEDMFEFHTSPNVGRTRGHITKAEMAELAAEAARVHVVLAPVFETLGHQDRLLSLPENRRFAERREPGEDPWSFAPVDPEARAFVKQLVDELAAATPGSPFFHIGGDESFDVGKGASRQAVEELGVGRVHAEFYADIARHIQSTWRRDVMVYADMLLRHEDSLQYLPGDLILIDWQYMPADDYPTVKKLRERGFHRVFVSPGLWSWACFYPDWRRAYQNVNVFVGVGKREGVLGSITSSWGDWGAENLRRNNWPGYAFSAAAEWERGGLESEPERFLRRFVAVHYGADLPELARAIKRLGWLDGIEEAHPVRRFHARPFIGPMKPGWTDKMRTLEAGMQQALAAIEAARPAVRFNAADLDPLAHAARRYLWMARRDQLLERVHLLYEANQGAPLDADRRREIAEEFAALRDELIAITAEFQTLWLRDCKFPMLQDNLKRLQDQVAILSNYVTRLSTEDLVRRDKPRMAWFWYPDDNPTSITTYGTRCFLRPLDIEQEPYIATLKFWADDSGSVFLDGERVLSASYGVEVPERNISGLLKPGRHWLAIRARNDFGAAGIAIELTLRSREGVVHTITGDEHWRVCRGELEGRDWMTAPPEGPDWIPVKIFGTGLIPPFDFIDW
ncbi:MAG: hypothetical protein Kow0059_05150 [Candidatus Sumerlaeia bacterium]